MGLQYIRSCSLTMLFSMLLIGASSFSSAQAVAQLELSTSVDGASLSKPGPLLAAGSTAQLAIKVHNPGSSALLNISINGRQKLPSLMPWRSLCTILRLEAGGDAICNVSQIVPDDIYKALIVASTSANGESIQVLENIFLRGAIGTPANPEPMPQPEPEPEPDPQTPPDTQADPARLSTQVSVNTEPSTRPGPLLTTSTTNWIYTVRNEGGLPVEQVEVLVRQKLPTLQPWRSVCTLNTLAAGASDACAFSEPAVEGIYKSLIVSRGISADGSAVENLTDAFYRGESESDTTVPEQNPTTGGEPSNSNTKGYKSLLAGHSFFKPITHDFTWLAAHAGFTEHEQTVIYSSGPTGAPQALWDDDDNRNAIQAVLDEGDVGLFGLTYHDDYPEEHAYIQWADYAFDKNPDTALFIAMPWGRWPGRFEVNEMEQFWTHHHEDVIHQIVDILRARYPGKRIFCVPYGMASTKLKTLFESGNLPDVQQLIGDHLTSIYNDELGHTGVLMKRLGALVWLQAIYGVDMQQFDYYDPYTADLKTLAADIMAVHNGDYDDPKD